MNKEKNLSSGFGWWGIAREPVQAELSAVRILFELLGFLLIVIPSRVFLTG